MDMFKRPPGVSVHQLLFFLIPCLLRHLLAAAVKSPENTEEIPDDPETAIDGDIQNGILLLLAV
jgi:hypothetical protein